MTKTANADLMDTLSRPNKECGDSSGSNQIGGFPRDFFHLKRPAEGAKVHGESIFSLGVLAMIISLWLSLISAVYVCIWIQPGQEDSST